MMSQTGAEPPIVALATPFTPSALAVIRTSGEGCIELVAALCADGAAVIHADGHTAVYERLRSPDGALLDEVVLTVYRAPRSYTGEDSVEISCHGSLPGVRRILDALLSAGFHRAEPGEFTRRAFMNGKMDLTRAEAVQEVVTAKTRDAHILALDRLGGSLFRRIDEAKQAILKQRAAVEVQLDYPDDEVEVDVAVEDIVEARRTVAALAAGYDRGRLYQDGVRVAIAGPTNAGKSSLFNLILRHDRAIVSPSPGTTRDYLEADVAIRGVPVRLFDTAGYREAVEIVESEGIERSGAVSRAAHAVLYVVDAVVGLADSDRHRIGELSKEVPVVLVWNKTDREEASSAPATVHGASSVVSVSVTHGAGLEAVEAAVIEAVMPESGGEEGVTVIDSLRQKQLLERSVSALDEVVAGLADGMPLDLVAVDMKDALDALGEITGEVTSTDILDTIFSGFCVGK